MSVIQSCHDTKDILDLFKPQSLFLKPISRLNVSVQLPQLKKSGAKISNWEVMEKVKEMAKPFIFSVFKVAKSSLEFIRFEAEIDNFGSMDQVLKNLDMKTIKLSGFHELLKVRAAEAKTVFPSRQDWDSFFRDNKNMNEMKAGERPDTLHIQNLPTKWFKNAHDRSGMTRDKPSELVVKKVFSTFGDIRGIDIPMLDLYRDQMKESISGIKTFSFGQDLVFDAFIQYKEYIGFVKAMNSLKGMKLLYKDRYEERSWVSNIKVDFDKTKHMAESTIKKRLQVRKKLIEDELEKEDTERRKKELEELKKAQELRELEESKKEKERHMSLQKQLKLKRQMEREERRRRIKIFGKTKSDDEKIAEEERKLLIAQRKLESIRILDELLERVKTVKSQSDNVKNLENDLLRTAREAKNKVTRSSSQGFEDYKDRDEKFLRDKLVNRLKKKEENKLKEQTSKLDEPKESSKNNIEKGEDESEEEGEEEDEEEEELRLTSSTEDEDGKEDIDDEGDRKKRKKEKKGKKKRRKEKKKKKKKDDEERRKRRELDSHISLAQRIADREKRSRSREKTRKEIIQKLPSNDEGYPDYRAVDRMRERENRRLALKNQKQEEEKAKEELYDKMMHPHLYGGDIPLPSKSAGTSRKLRRGEHYEQIQKEHLENEIRIRERREKAKQRMAESRQWREEDERRNIKRRPPPNHYQQRNSNQYSDRRDYERHSFHSHGRQSHRRVNQNGGSHDYRN
uniref:Akinase anchor protein 17Alike [Saccoglossus kowalevskii] n=1 Tax=Lepeophtheirus salmonis TaxID=72036 RepID=A0A0K2TPJ1_LEPSM